MYQRRQPSSMPCPRCKQLIGVNSDRCMHCGLQNPSFFATFPVLGSLVRNEIRFSGGIMILCFGLFITALALDISTLVATGGAATLLLQPSSKALFNLGMGGRFAWEMGRWWTLLTANYLHGSILHILFNMWVLRSYGNLAEEVFGSSRFIIIYTVAGLTGSLVSTLMGTPAFVGASGAIFGLGGALIFYGWHRGGTFGRSLMGNLLIWAAINFVIGLSMSYVDNWGHLGGLVGGLVAALFLGYEERRRQELWHHILALLTLVFIVVCFVMMLTTFISSAL